MTYDPTGRRPDDEGRERRREEPPPYRVYRARPRLLDRLRRPEPEGVANLRGRRAEGEALPRRRRPLTIGRLLRWLVLAALAWVALSVGLFLLSAQLQGGASERTEAALSPGGNLLTGSTVLVLGSDRRPEGTKEPGADTRTGRADSLLLLRVGLGRVRRLSILRDSLAEIPGHGSQKINSAYAFGGAGLTIQTVERFLGNGLRVNHVIEVSFEDFPDFVDALGGIDVELDRCISSDPFGGRRFRLSRGEHHLDGRQALAFARVRKNRCAPNDDDRARARRQQQVLSAIRSRLLSPATFLRLPWVSWHAPRTVSSDMRGPGLSALFADLLTGGGGQTRVLLPSGVGPGGSLIISEQERAKAVRALLGR